MSLVNDGRVERIAFMDDPPEPLPGLRFARSNGWRAPMGPYAFAETAEFYRVDAGLKLDPERRSTLGQFMTPVPIGRFMANLFGDLSGDLRVLDPGAGVGSLTAALVERLCATDRKPRSASFTCYEIDPVLASYLRDTLDEASIQCGLARIASRTKVFEEDFILANGSGIWKGTFPVGRGDRGFTHAILNPPYKKILSSSAHRAALRNAGMETSNLYTGFMFLAAQALEDGGELVAIVPRSFCNGPYFKPFRKRFFAMMAFRQIHSFERRNSAFRGDDVLQENIILHAIKGERPPSVTITTSGGGEFEIDRRDGGCFAHDMTRFAVPYDSVIRPNDPDRFVHIAANHMERGVVDRMGRFTATLADLGVSVSTGPVIDFRLKPDLRHLPEHGAVPLLYARHFNGGELEWPKTVRKPNAIHVSESSRRWLWSNEGHFVITRRFTAKEERRRVVASVYRSDLPGELVGFENHLNVFHVDRKGLSPELARGLAIFLNSTLVDRFFRQFNGHTQVNATDLRSLRYPEREVLERIGRDARSAALSQNGVDAMIDGELKDMPDGTDPIRAQRKVDDALEILKAFGMPKGQLNDRSALTLLALLDLRPSGSWDRLGKPLMGITPIMEFIRRHYGREYAPNTRETFRRQTMHQFVEAGLALYNPDRPDRAVNSPKACYRIGEPAFQAMLTFGTERWEVTLESYLAGRETLVARWARRREMRMIPVKVADGQEIRLTPGAHSELIRDIITEFAPRFAPGAEVIHVGDTGDRDVYNLSGRLSELGVTIDPHGKMPDVVLHFGDRDWLLLVESVTSHGPVDAKRHGELASLFKGAKPGLVYVTAFPDRGVMGRHLSEISWETEVWCADAPTHLIHFNGERFLAPYTSNGQERK